MQEVVPPALQTSGLSVSRCGWSGPGPGPVRARSVHPQRQRRLSKLAPCGRRRLRALERLAERSPAGQQVSPRISVRRCFPNDIARRGDTLLTEQWATQKVGGLAVASPSLFLEQRTVRSPQLLLPTSSVAGPPLLAVKSCSSPVRLDPAWPGRLDRETDFADSVSIRSTALLSRASHEARGRRVTLVTGYHLARPGVRDADGR